MISDAFFVWGSGLSKGQMMKTRLLLNPQSRRTGLTLLELLVVVAILGIIASLTIPRLRIISADRKVREAARIVGSVFSEAAQRAVTDGASGVCIETNPNIRDKDGVRYAGTALYMMKAVAPYSGDYPYVASDPDSGATRSADNMLYITLPYGHVDNDPKKEVVRVGDKISVNNSSIQFLIKGKRQMPDPNNSSRTILMIEVELGGLYPALPGVNPPPPAIGTTYPFVVHRQPRIQESSRVQLPEGYLVDLRYSGPLTSTKPNGTPLDNLAQTGAVPTRTIFHNANGNNDVDRSNCIFFGNGMERITARGGFDVKSSRDTGLFVAAFSADGKNESFRNTALTSSPDNADPLDDITNLWVGINTRTGAVAVVPNLPSASATDLPARLGLASGLRSQGATVSD